MKIDRLLGILNILGNRDRITINELAERFEVSKRTISRDLETLNQAGIPIITYPGAGGGVAIIEGYKCRESIFSKKDIKNIFTAISGLMSINKNNDLINLMAKIIPEDTDAIFSESDYMIDLSSWFKDSIMQKKVSDLHEAIEDRKCVSIEYISKNSRRVRVINPYKIVFKQSYWYVYGFCEESDDFRLFRINRIASYELMDKEFNLRPINNIQFKDNFSGDLFYSKDSRTLYDVRLEYDSTDEYLITTKVDAQFLYRKSDEAKGCIVFQVSDLDWTADMVIELQDKVRVLEPEELKDIVKIKINKISEIYR